MTDVTTGSQTTSTQWTVTPVAVDAPEALEILRAYYFDIVGRYFRRAATVAEVEGAMADEPNDGLVPPAGQFLVARLDGQAVGCVGYKMLTPQIAELKRVFLREPARGLGGADRLLDAVEQAARDQGATAMRLDVRGDLVEARRLYARRGYVQIEPYSDAQYADYWLEKPLD